MMAQLSGRRYLEVVLRLGKLAPGFVDSYAGPRELAECIAAEPPPTREELVDQIRELLTLAEADDDPGRRSWLRAQLAALELAAASLGGEQRAYVELVERCHGVRPELEPEDSFAEAHGRLDAVLPGGGRVAERYQAWLETQIVPGEKIGAALTRLADELREHTRERFGLPDGERVELEVVKGKPWAGYARYTGDLRSQIFINADLSLASHRLLELVAHEAYPGHHTEHVAKETALVRPHGHLEHQVFLYPTPQALVAEGIAQLALEMALGDDADNVAAACLRPLGIAYDAETAARVRAAKELLLPVLQNVALLDLPPQDAWAYLRRWRVDSDAHVDRTIDSYLTLAWRPYTSCYPEGLRFARTFVSGDSARFTRLLREPLTPASLCPG
jgi:hypothetical protein